MLTNTKNCYFYRRKNIIENANLKDIPRLLDIEEQRYYEDIYYKHYSDKNDKMFIINLISLFFIVTIWLIADLFKMSYQLHLIITIIQALFLLIQIICLIVSIIFLIRILNISKFVYDYRMYNLKYKVTRCRNCGKIFVKNRRYYGY